MTGPVLATFTEELNGGASIGSTLLFQLLNLAKAMVEQQRPWMILRDTDTSKTVSASTDAWQTAIDLSTITRFSRFYGEEPIKNFDGNNRVDKYRQVPLNKRLEYRDASYTFTFNDGSKTLYLNGGVAAGTLWIDYIKDSADLENSDASSWVFPSWAHPLLAFVAVGIHKGGIDYDDVNARMAPENRAQAAQIMRMLEKWDGEKQLSSQMEHDPSSDGSHGFRSGSINIGA
jgi:hypothetical protein